MNQIVFSLFIAAIPIFFWYIILRRSQAGSLSFFFWTVFSFAMVFAYFWKIYAEFFALNYFSVLVGAFLSFVIVGAIIEYGKNIIIRFIGHNFFETLDDVVDLSFATALGFTFMENILFFYELFAHDIGFNSSILIVKEVISRSFFILPIHLFCSGIFGYFYGLSLFALPEVRKSWGRLYPHIQIIKGTIISMFTYGLFFFIIEKDLMLSDLTHFFGYEDLPVDERLLPILSFAFSAVSGLYLFHRMEQSLFLTETKTERVKRLEKEEKEKAENSK